MFYQGQRVVCIQKREIGSKGSRTPLIEGKSYYVANPNRYRDETTIYIMISGIDKMAFDQNHFVPYDEDKAMEDEIFESLKGVQTEH